MIYFKINAEMLRTPDYENNRAKLKAVLAKFDDADKELERVCKELGIPKPEVGFLDD